MHSFNLIFGFFFAIALFCFVIESQAAWGVEKNEDVSASQSPVSLLSMGDDELASDNYHDAENYYRKGVSLISDSTDLVISLSLYVNLGTALSSSGNNNEAVDSYISAIALHDTYAAKQELSKEEHDITAQAAFFLGMTYQDMEKIPPAKAADAYALAASLDPRHWSALANLGAVLYDEIRDYTSAVSAYGAAFKILTEKPDDGSVPTDPPYNPRPILSQLQYRIGMCVIMKPDQKCAFDNDPSKEHSCKEVAARAFSLAIKYDDSNVAAKHMLATITADATMERASNVYITDLFDQYASK
uniref:Uncharacterized protein n=1 Tax=Corethron hystrix TaxID=216773 RepID=A0A7S1G083_9STRA|mmetsp:Transcript_40932/g.96049  ORF Transcript_40932/g.96049 Transcript_40932/m.96049 type:complete len:301 (+) Transcript_40932:129-1031(+)